MPRRKSIFARGSDGMGWAAMKQEPEDSVETTFSQVASEVANMRSSMLEMKTDIRELRQGIIRVDDKVDGARNDLSTRIDGVRNDLSVKIDGVRNDLSTRIDEVRSELSGKVEEVRHELTDKIEGVHSNLSGRIDGVHSSLSGRIDGVHGNLSVRIEGVRSDLSVRIDGVHGNLSGRIECVHSDLSVRIDDVRKDLSGRIDKQSDKTDLMRKDISDLNVSLEKSFARFTKWAIGFYIGMGTGLFYLIARGLKWM